jgi:hypothetical protein
VRYRTSVIRERASELNRIAKVLEGANIKLASVSTNIGAVSGRAILTALVENTTDPEVLADLARGRFRNKHDALVAALSGRVGSHQRFLLAPNCAIWPISTSSSRGSISRSRSVFVPSSR